MSLFIHRLYHPQIRRWLTTDPLSFEDGWNLYAYVHNNPFRYTDPDGQWAIFLELITIAFGESLKIGLFTAIEYSLGAAGVAAVGWAGGNVVNTSTKKMNNGKI